MLALRGLGLARITCKPFETFTKACRSLTQAAVDSSGDSDHVEEFRDTVRTFAQGFVAPHAADIDKNNRYKASDIFTKRIFDDCVRN